MVSRDLPVIRVSVDYLDGAIDTYVNELPFGYKLDMIRPADDPTEAWLSNETEKVHLRKRLKPYRSRKGGIIGAAPPVIRTEWHAGRAGMEYRDLIPDRRGGKVIASHIRLTKGGEVPDYVHYHKIEFQVICCLKGRIKVVYEDQGEPFWLEPGDIVVQPPEIRHRVLECEANSEVIEITMPAEHETWIDHELKLPNVDVNPNRIFGTQRFVRKIRARNVGAQDNFRKTLLEITETMPNSQSISRVIHDIIPSIQPYLAENS